MSFNRQHGMRRDRLFEFDISERAEGEWRILSFVSRADQHTEMANAGLL